MDVDEILENGYDEKVKKIIRKLNKGKDRDEVAEEIGYSSKSGLDSFMRRRDFKFDGKEGMYIPKEEEDDEGEEVEDIPPEAGSKVSLIIGLFENTEQEPEEIAKSVGFDNFRELADFMERKGYCWNSQRENYESKHKDKDRDVVTEENKEE